MAQGKGIITGLEWAVEGGIIGSVGAGSVILGYDIIAEHKDILSSLAESVIFWFVGGVAGALIGGIAGSLQPGLAEYTAIPPQEVGELNPFEEYQQWPNPTNNFY